MSNPPLSFESRTYTVPLTPAAQRAWIISRMLPPPECKTPQPSSLPCCGTCKHWGPEVLQALCAGPLGKERRFLLVAECDLLPHSETWLSRQAMESAGSVSPIDQVVDGPRATALLSVCGQWQPRAKAMEADAVQTASRVADGAKESKA